MYTSQYNPLLVSGEVCFHFKFGGTTGANMLLEAFQEFYPEVMGPGRRLCLGGKLMNRFKYTKKLLGPRS
jgi:hypothetical protein